MDQEATPAPASWLARHLRPLILAALTLVAYTAALNRGQTMLWAIAALMSATLLVGVVWPHWLVKRLSVVRSGPGKAEEGETISFQVEVENHGLLPRFMVELIDRLPFADASDGLLTLGVVSHVPGRSIRRFTVPLHCEKRGYYRLGPVGLGSSFPLGLAEARQQRNDGVQSLTVYPDVFPIMELPLRGAPSQIHRGGYLLPQGAGAAEFAGLREYQRGDNPRHVHWPTTARLNELMIKEFEPLASACLFIVLDQSLAANVGEGKQAIFEYAVRVAASIARFSCSNAIATRLIGKGEDLLYMPAGDNEHHYQTILDELAVVAANGYIPYSKVLERVGAECQPGETVVVFLSEPAELLEETLQALALLRTRGANLFALVFERDSFTPIRKASDRETAAMATACLLDLGATCLTVRRDTDLVKLFNT